MRAGDRGRIRAVSDTDEVCVLIVGDHALIRAGLRKVLEDAEVGRVEEDDGGAGLAEAVVRARPDVVLVDRDTYDAARLEAIANAVRARGRARLLVLTGDRAPETHQGLVRLGAMGCVTKDEPAEVLVKAVEKVSRGDVWFDRSTLARALEGGRRAALRAETDSDASRIGALTEREMEIVRRVAEGLKNKQIARRLCISEVTVRHHLTSVYSKLGVANRQRLMLYAFQKGLAWPPFRAAG